MSGTNRQTGFAIAIAWPETYCKQPGSWYDPLAGILGISKNNYYKAGHAALVLVDAVNRKCHYFDFGRYHAPFQHGRVRSAETDTDLEMHTVPVISADRSALENYQEILNELQKNTACHGEGRLFASYCPVDFNAAIETALAMQRRNHIPYGPFRKGGTNCSRFVNTVILAGLPALKYRLRLRYFVPFTPAPKSNVNALTNKTILPVIVNNKPFSPAYPPDRSFLRTTLPQPELHSSIPRNAIWLSGEGAGSWFVIKADGGNIKITRYSSAGVPECEGDFVTSDGAQFIPDDSLSLGYPSNCREILIYKGNEEYRLKRVVNV